MAKQRFLLGGLLALSTSSLHAETKRTATVRGPLTVACRATSGHDQGQYEYKLSGKAIRSLSSECSPGYFASYISIEQVFHSQTSTTLLIIEGVSADSQNVRVLYIPKVGSALLVETLGGDGFALVQKSPSKFKLTNPSGGFVNSGDRKSTWTCVFEIDFAKGIASGSLAVPFEPDLPLSICNTKVARRTL
jgi:hypothetical protein